MAGFAPPLASEAAAAVLADPRHRALWQGYRTRVPALFAELGFPFVDASTPAALGLDDRFLVDGLHGEETFHVHLLRRMLDDARVEAELPGARAVLERALASPATYPWYPDLGHERAAEVEREDPRDGGGVGLR